MPYEIDNQGRTNEVQRVTSPAPVQRDTAPAPLARVEQIGSMTRVTVRSDGGHPDEKPAPSNPTPVREGGVVERFNTYTGEYTATRPDEKPTDSAPVSTDPLNTAFSPDGSRVPRHQLNGQTLVKIGNMVDTLDAWETVGYVTRNADGKYIMPDNVFSDSSSNRTPTAAANTSATNTTKLPASSEPEQTEQVP